MALSARELPPGLTRSASSSGQLPVEPSELVLARPVFSIQPELVPVVAGAQRSRSGGTMTWVQTEPGLRVAGPLQPGGASWVQEEPGLRVAGPLQPGEASWVQKELGLQAAVPLQLGEVSWVQEMPGLRAVDLLYSKLGSAKEALWPRLEPVQVAVGRPVLGLIELGPWEQPEEQLFCWLEEQLWSLGKGVPASLFHQEV